MTSPLLDTTADRHQQALVDAVARLLAELGQRPQDAPTRREVPAGSEPPALDRLITTFGLTTFEASVVVAAAGMELSTELATVVARLAGGEPRLSLGLLLRALGNAHWNVLSPERPLRKWGLVELLPGRSALHTTLRIDERILQHLVGLDVIDPRTGLRRVEDDGGSVALEPRLDAVLGRLRDGPWTLSLTGPRPAGKQSVARAVAERLDRGLLALELDDVPSSVAERRDLARLVARELRLRSAALFIDADRDPTDDDLRRVALIADEIEAPVMIASREPLRQLRRPPLVWDVARPSREAQRALWSVALGTDATSALLDRLVGQFDMGPAQIGEAARLAVAGEDGELDVWSACRSVSRRRLDDLAQRVVLPAADRATSALSDRAASDEPPQGRALVLPAAQMQTLRDIVSHARHRSQVLERWHFAEHTPQGQGNTALFHGPSGTGKTMAAEILARELDLDLYRIDLSQVVSKFIGETEKNLRRVFDAAEEGGAILLFDEADALFGKRTEQTRDSHDRYANLEVSYLLQRMEAYRGLAILTTNMKNALDDAFLRRIRFVVAFPFPGPEERRRIWRGIFPPEAPVGPLEYDRLAQLALAGGNIANIAMNAAYLAAAQSRERIDMEHVAAAARAEYAKLEWPITTAAIKGLL